MKRIVTCLAASLFVALGSLAQAQTVVGDFEGTTLGGGFSDWNGTAAFSNSTIGATHGTMSIKEEPGSFGFYQGLAFKIQTLPNAADAFNSFNANTHVAIDVTFNTADFDYTGSGWNGGRLLMFYNERGAGWQGNIGVDIGDANGFKVPNVDTGNTTNPGFWDMTNYPGITTRTMMWDYSSYKAALTSNATDGWIEFVIGNNLGNFNTAALYFDNIRFVTPTPTFATADFNHDTKVDNLDLSKWETNFSMTGQTDNTNGDANGDMVVDGADVAIWQRQLNMPTGGFSAVPEPASAALAALCCGLGLRRRSRRK